MMAWVASYVAKRAIVRLTLSVSRPVMGIGKPLGLGQRLDQQSKAIAKTQRMVFDRLRLQRKRTAGDSEPEAFDGSDEKSGEDVSAVPLQDSLQVRARERAQARAETLGQVLRSLALAVIWTLAVVLIMGEIGVNLGPLIAGAGIVGVALGFGSQSIVKDFLSGLFMLMEDSYGVGDMVDFGGVMGNVLDVSLRSTSFKDRNGTVWHVPNGEIRKVGNFSQLGLRARLNIEVAYDTDLRMAIRVTNRVGVDMWESGECREKLVGPPKVSGIQELGQSAVIIRVVVETVPGLPWPDKRKMERTFRLLLKEAYDNVGIEMPFPQQDLWIRTPGDGATGKEPLRQRPDESRVFTSRPRGSMVSARATRAEP